jgi:hypothetical protein
LRLLARVAFLVEARFGVGEPSEVKMRPAGGELAKSRGA